MPIATTLLPGRPSLPMTSFSRRILVRRPLSAVAADPVSLPDFNLVSLWDSSRPGPTHLVRRNGWRRLPEVRSGVQTHGHLETVVSFGLTRCAVGRNSTPGAPTVRGNLKAMRKSACKSLPRAENWPHGTGASRA